MKLTKHKLAATFLIASILGANAHVAAAELKTYESNGIVEFVPDDAITPPTDPENPDPEKPVNPWDPTTPGNKPNPGTSGPLSLDYASSLDFGKNKISNKDEVYYVDPQYLWKEDLTGIDETIARPNYVQITDKRGNNAGWILTVKQDGQFKHATTQNKVLTGSEIAFKEGIADSNIENIIPPKTVDINLVPDAETTFLTAEKGAGAGTWVERFGEVEEMQVDGKTVKKNKAITLSIPGSIPKDAVKYETKLIWSLKDVPANNEEIENP